MKLTKPVSASAQQGVAEWCQHTTSKCVERATRKGYSEQFQDLLSSPLECGPLGQSDFDCLRS